VQRTVTRSVRSAIPGIVADVDLPGMKPYVVFTPLEKTGNTLLLVDMTWFVSWLIDLFLKELPPNYLNARVCSTFRIIMRACKLAATVVLLLLAVLLIHREKFVEECSPARTFFRMKVSLPKSIMILSLLLQFEGTQSLSSCVYSDDCALSDTLLVAGIVSVNLCETVLGVVWFMAVMFAEKQQQQERQTSCRDRSLFQQQSSRQSSKATSIGDVSTRAPTPFRGLSFCSNDSEPRSERSAVQI
jgi:hypothetical protein